MTKPNSAGLLLLQVLEGCQKIVGTQTFKTAGNLLDERAASVFRITSGSKEFDSLCGGWESRTLTELHGEYRTGKTQLCMTAVGQGPPPQLTVLHCAL
jgi:RecA/RadA recombinase